MEMGLKHTLILVNKFLEIHVCRVYSMFIKCVLWMELSWILRIILPKWTYFNSILCDLFSSTLIYGAANFTYVLWKWWQYYHVLSFITWWCISWEESGELDKNQRKKVIPKVWALLLYNLQLILISVFGYKTSKEGIFTKKTENDCVLCF